MNYFCLKVAAIAAALACAGFLPATTTDTVTVTSATTQFSSGFSGELEKTVASFHGVMGIYCKKLDGSEEIAVNADELFETASTIKTAVMCTVFDLLDKGTGPFKGYYDTRVYDAATSTGGSGFIQNYKDGTKIELKELMHFMITASDNTATNIICDWVGLDAVNKWLVNHKFKKTRMYSTIGGRQVWNKKGRADWGLGRTTPREMGNLMGLIASGKAASPAATDEMLRLLSHQYFDGSIPAGLPPMAWVGSKSGSLNSSRSDCAIINGKSGPYVLIIYTKNNEDRSWTPKNEAQVAMQKISTMVWNHFNPGENYTPPAGLARF